MELKISSPCPKKWDDLVGNDRIRYCGQCKLNVYNFADMTQTEISGIVRKTEGRLCASIYLRGDRSATLRDCPTTRRSSLLRRLVGVGALLVLGAFTWICRGAEQPDREGLPKWIRVPLGVIDPEPVKPKPQPQPPRLLGEIPCVPPPPPLPPPPPSTTGS
ncbi:MAG TPA: hypothetical protein VE981_11465 [Planctomycetota bacterium]|nr:hypothetical protein [Planctomycetota bacterium]